MDSSQNAKPEDGFKEEYYAENRWLTRLLLGFIASLPIAASIGIAFLALGFATGPLVLELYGWGLIIYSIVGVFAVYILLD